jgi:hypothetical protein
VQTFGAIVTFFVVWFLIACIASFCVMMGVDNIHDWWSFIPTMGFWQAFSVTVWFAIPLAIYSGYNSSSS